MFFPEKTHDGGWNKPEGGSKPKENSVSIGYGVGQRHEQTRKHILFVNFFCYVAMKQPLKINLVTYYSIFKKLANGNTIF
jgi:hypothetical protein